MLERREDGTRYARVAPDRIAGTVSVCCTQSAPQDETEVTVTYDVTSLGPQGAAFVEELEAASTRSSQTGEWRFWPASPAAKTATPHRVASPRPPATADDLKDGEMFSDSPLIRG